MQSHPAIVQILISANKVPTWNTHAIGLGGRDLSREVGGISALTALEMLSADEKSEVLAFVSKPPAEAVRLKIVNAMKATGKPTVALF